MENIKYVLASASPRRRELLGRLQIPFSVLVSNADEFVAEGTPPATAAQTTAQKKAEAVLAQVGDALVIGADTVVVLEDRIMGKPVDTQDAVQMLTALSGKTHRVITGVCLCYGNRIRTFAEETAVTFYPLTTAEIRDYVATGEPMDKAGAYGIQGLGCTLVQGIAGDYNNVVGLPVGRLKREIQKILGE